MIGISWRRLHLNSSFSQRVPRRFLQVDAGSLFKETISSLYFGGPITESYTALSSMFAQAMRACNGIKSLGDAQKIHGRLTSSGLESSIFLQNHLLSMYSNCGSFGDTLQVFNEIRTPNIFSWNILIAGLVNLTQLTMARDMFDKMPAKDSVSWNTMMNAYFQNGMSAEALDIFIAMVRSCFCVVDPLSFSCALKACAGLKNLELGLQVQGLLLKFDYGRDHCIEASILDMYIKCEAMELASKVFERMVAPSVFCWNSMIFGCSKSSGAGTALEIFNRMPEKDVVSWNTVISILSQHGYGSLSLSMLVKMEKEGFKPNSITYASVLCACASILDVDWGKHLHARTIRSLLSNDVFVGTALVDMYAKFSHVESAKLIFNRLPCRSAVSWTSLISGFAKSGLEREALLLFTLMRKVSVVADQFTLATVLDACSSKKDWGFGIQCHTYTIKTGYHSSVAVGNALLTMYMKCGSFEMAKLLFSLMLTRDVISWTTMITGFSQIGDVYNARALFDKVPERNIVTWNCMLAAYVQQGYKEEGIKLYILMLLEDNLKPDWITFATLLRACSDMAVLSLGDQIVVHTVKKGFNVDVSVANAIVTMYSKCGRIEQARDIFDSISEKDLVSWNAMITGYAQNGLGKKAIAVFDVLLSTGIQPDYISYIGVLSGCSHSGLVSEGQFYFYSMVKDHNISPRSEHFACMVDLLGRAGLLAEAKTVIDEMPIEPGAGVWGALLGACRIHKNTTLAEYAMKHLIEMDPKDSGGYVLLANIYAETSKIDGLAEVRKLMKERGVRKNPGCSWIDVDSRIHVFTVDDSTHPQIEEVNIMLDEVIRKIKGIGYANKMICEPQNRHSEKLAVAFGLLRLPAWKPINIMKNLRICDDCHVTMKFVSLAFLRDLIVRDGNRFHHFREGCCSCGDYW